MPQEAESGRRLARDMRRIREAHNLTVNDLHDETKIPVGLLEAFEDTALFDHPQFNRVYLRSFARTYAQVVGIDADLAMEALEEALSDRYVGSLAVEYLGEEPVVEETPQPAEVEEPDLEKEGEEPGADAATAAEEERREEAADAERRDEVTDEGRREKAERRAEKERADEEEDMGGPPMVSTTAEAAAGYEEVTSEEEGVDEDWTVQSPPPGGPRRAPTDHGGLDRRWIIGGVMVLVVGVIVWILVGVLDGDADQATQPIAAADTVQMEDTTAPQQPEATPIDVPALGDTMDVYIVAADGSVDPIRVTVDDDLRRPYWIDQGDSMLFQPTERIVVEELLDNVDLKIEGIEYPTDRRDEQGRVVITRDSVQAHFASLQGGQ